jgi:hypothetical protein
MTEPTSIVDLRWLQKNVEQYVKWAIIFVDNADHNRIFFIKIRR